MKKVGNRKKLEIGKCRKSEKVGNQKKQEIGKSRKLEKVGNQKKVGYLKKQEIRKRRKSEKVGIQKKQEIIKGVLKKSTDQRINKNLNFDQLGHGLDLWSCFFSFSLLY